MVYKKIQTGYILRFNKDEKLVKTLHNFAIKNELKGAWISGLGAASGVTLGYYSLEKQDYIWKDFTKMLEITNLTGDISWHNNEIIGHLHGSFSDDNFKMYGGHIKELIVGGTCEVYIIDLTTHINRQHDVLTGLNILDL